jgi:LAO/AO transport system ATPase
VLEALLARFHRGDRLALSKLLSAASRGHDREAILAQLPRKKPSRVVAITGSAGVGKSTLVGKLIETIRSAGQTVAVLACDPQSPLSGGALLGDRFRMAFRPGDDGVFIRSLATPGGRGAVVDHIEDLVVILEAFGFDVIIIETVGAGQGDTIVRSVADVVVLLLQPETGDDLQWEKAGVFEVADIIAIHKADLPGAESAEAQVRAALGLSSSQEVVVLRISSKTGEGVAPLWEAIATRPLRRQQQPADGHELLHLAQEAVAARFTAAIDENDSKLQELLRRWQGHEISPAEAARQLLALLTPQN